uniref:Uncharacterized protein n=1 Tax=Oryza sativa subsp. japonica TaxID=39947 RepID=Q8H5M6_ORYSJ|nr:hypothetical protein [Oryza sativa Japonica Group]BAD30170.1 hypothetical protein [Oryza sativa Japonica Group]
MERRLTPGVRAWSLHLRNMNDAAELSVRGRRLGGAAVKPCEEVYVVGEDEMLHTISLTPPVIPLPSLSSSLSSLSLFFAGSAGTDGLVGSGAAAGDLGEAAPSSPPSLSGDGLHAAPGPVASNDNDDMVGSCNCLWLKRHPLVCGSIIVINPVTGESLHIPSPPLATSRSRHAGMISFGYHSTTGKYKIVHFPSNGGLVDEVTLGGTASSSSPPAMAAATVMGW